MHGTKNNGLEQPAHASTSAAVQSNVVYPAPGMSTRRFEYRAAPDKRSLLAVTVSDLALPPGATINAVIDWLSCPAVERDPTRVSGAWLFRGTRVPVAALFENLEDDASVQQFIEWFPGVTLEQARTVLEQAARSSLAAV